LSFSFFVFSITFGASAGNCVKAVSAYFAYHRDPDFPSGGDRIASYRQTLDNWRREFDVLVSTTIIESGLDVPNANTLIIERAVFWMSL
jgi:superfamily II DNA or RNA helicase